MFFSFLPKSAQKSPKKRFTNFSFLQKPGSWYSCYLFTNSSFVTKKSWEKIKANLMMGLPKWLEMTWKVLILKLKLHVVVWYFCFAWLMWKYCQQTGNYNNRYIIIHKINYYNWFNKTPHTYLHVAFILQRLFFSVEQILWKQNQTEEEYVFFTKFTKVGPW